MKKSKVWITIGALFGIFLIVFILNIPRILRTVFEQSVRGFEERCISVMSEEWHPRIENAFDALIFSFKNGEVKKEDLNTFFSLITSGDGGQELSSEVVEEIIIFIENITHSR